LDHYLRRPSDQDYVVGTLLGTKDGSRVEIQTGFSVPLRITKEEGIILDKEFLVKMMKFHKKVNPKEGLIGLYFSSNLITNHVMQLFSYFIELMKDKKNKPLLDKPLLMLVDPTMKENRMSIKVMSLVNARPLPVFAECPYSF